MAVALREDTLATLGAVHLGAMREHDRKAALLCREGDRWEETPDWRVDRNVIRLGLYVSERLGVLPGERVAVASPLRRESLLVDLATAVQGIVPVAVDPDLAPAELAAAVAEVAPRAVFAPATVLERLGLADVPPAGEDGGRTRPPPAAEARTFELVALDGLPSGAATLSEVLDLGGTLDTAERAVAFRARVRGVAPDRPALAWVEAAPGRAPALRSMTHREAAEYVRALWAAEPARRGDLAYVSAGGAPAEVRLAALAFVGDGTTTLALGTPGREAEEIAALRPHKIVVVPAALEAAREHGADRRAAAAGVRGWLEHALRAPARYLHRDGDGEAAAEPGPRARWIRSSASLPPAAAQRARAIGAAGPGVDGIRGGAP